MIDDLQSNGGLSEKTVRKRKKTVNYFYHYLYANDISEQLDTLMKTPSNLEPILIGFFESMRVGNTNELPSRNYIESIKSHLKNHILIQTEGTVNIGSFCQFPALGRFFKGLAKDLKKKGKGDTKHHEAIDNASLTKIFTLFQNVMEALKLIGTRSYEDRIGDLIPSSYKDNYYHYLLQSGAQLILTLLQARRGREGLAEIKKDSLELVSSSTVSYYKKVKREATKNHQFEPENLEKEGVILFTELECGFNPGAYTKTYLDSLNPSNPYLFQRPCQPAKSFSIHNPQTTVLFEPNAKVGEHKIGNMLPELCHLLGLRRYTNHCIRTSAIVNMKTAGIEDRKIAAITGHKALGSLSN